MTKWIIRKMKTVIGVERGICRHLWLFVLVGLVLAVACICISRFSRSGEKVIPKKVRVYPQQEVLVKYCEGMLMGRNEDALSSATADWPEKDRFLAIVKDVSEKIEFLEYTIGPVETLEWETIDEAHLVAVSKPSETSRNRSTGKVKTFPERGKNLEWIVEKRKTPDGPRWFMVADSQYFGKLAMSWLHQPRKKVPDSATIVLKKDITKKEIIVQILSDGEVVSERKISY